MKWKVISSEYLHKEPWLTIRKDRCELPNGKDVPAFFINEYPDWVNVLAVTKEGQVLMVRQYRHGIGEVGVELPGGVAEKGETPEEAGRRELVEETGYEFEEFIALGKVSANPSTTNNFTHMFLARGGTKTAVQKLDETEDLEVELYSMEDFKALLRDNKIMQSLHVTCALYALNRLGELSY
jgi:8-oxo-dGTP pyrophosphatase MutT (NUDIX family)